MKWTCTTNDHCLELEIPLLKTGCFFVVFCLFGCFVFFLFLFFFGGGGGGCFRACVNLICNLHLCQRIICSRISTLIYTKQATLTLFVYLCEITMKSNFKDYNKKHTCAVCKAIFSFNLTSGY